MYPNQCQSKSNCSHIVRQCRACHHLICQISHFHFLFRVCHDVWLPRHQLLMRPLPFWSLSEPFCSTSWSMAVYLSSSSCHPPACRFTAVISHFSLWLAWHISLLLSSSKSPKKGLCWRVNVLVCEDSGYFSEVRLWRQYPLVEEIINIDMFKSCTLWWHLWFRTSDESFSCLCISLVPSINSPNATSLQNCIHVAFERGC